MDDLQVVEEKMVPFNGIELLAIKTNDGKIHAGVKWVCQGLGLSEGQTKAERKKFQQDLVLSKGGRNFILPTKGGKQEVLCVELGFLPLWLAKITLTPSMQRERPWTVQRLVDFQLRAKDVLEEAFLNKPKSIEDLIIMQAQSMKDVKQRLENVEKQQENIKEIISLNPNEWRKKTTILLNKIAVVRGGFEEYRIVRNESYEKLEDRAHCRLERRLTNRRREMALNGVPKSKIDSVSKLDIIAEDVKLIEIYLAVVKDMAIVHKINAEGLVCNDLLKN